MSWPASGYQISNLISRKKAAANGADVLVMQSKIKVIKNPDGSTTKKLAAWAIRLNK